jgi:phage terminase large subunit-like protein
MKTPKFGGLDLAQRVDNSALVVLKLEDGKLSQVGQKTWAHIDYEQVFNDVSKINNIEEGMHKICYDRTGVGDAVAKLINPEIRNIFRPVVLSAPKKFELISLMKGMFNRKKLIIHDRDLFREITEQEIVKSDAGNILYRHPQGFHDDRFWALALACDAASNHIRGYSRPAAVAATPRSLDLNTLVDQEINKMMYS